MPLTFHIAHVESRLAILRESELCSSTRSRGMKRCCMSSKIVLITGCSTGIGHDLARRLTLANYAVIATARHPETLTDLQVALKLPLDVTDSASVASAT